VDAGWKKAKPLAGGLYAWEDAGHPFATAKQPVAATA
jgi:hypothetical protein